MISDVLFIGVNVSFRMPSDTPFFDGMRRLLFGRPPVSRLEKMARGRDELGQICMDQFQQLFGAFFPSGLMDFKADSGANSRRRVFTPAVTFRAFPGQAMDPRAPCRKALARVQALFASRGLVVPSCSTAAYCNARRRLPVRWLVRVLEAISDRLAGISGGRILLVDGTTVLLSDTPENQANYPQSAKQKPGCGFPLMKLVGLFDVCSGAWLGVARGSKHDGENTLARRLFRHLRSGDTLVADRGFCSYEMICELAELGVDVVMRNHQSRRSSDFRTGKRLGKGDHLIVWERPKGRRYAHLPKHLVLREVRAQEGRKGFRTRTMVLVTTILLKEEMGREQIGEIHMRRWSVELFLDDIKTTMCMEMLRTKSPAMACRELLMHMIAYNLVRVLVARSAAGHGRASYKGALDRLDAWGDLVWAARSRKAAERLADKLLETIAEDEVPDRPGRREPRVNKRRPKPYQNLTRQRREMREIPHRSKYKKKAA